MNGYEAAAGVRFERCPDGSVEIVFANGSHRQIMVDDWCSAVVAMLPHALHSMETFRTLRAAQLGEYVAIEGVAAGAPATVAEPGTAAVGTAGAPALPSAEEGVEIDVDEDQDDG